MNLFYDNGGKTPPRNSIYYQSGKHNKKGKMVFIDNCCHKRCSEITSVDRVYSALKPWLRQYGDYITITAKRTAVRHLGDGEKNVQDICGVVEIGTLPGFVSYKAGQAAVGDIFDWFVKNCVPASFNQEAKQAGKRVFQLLEEKVEKLKPGQSGLVELDWFNSNRTVLVNADLSGLIMGFTLDTKPEEIFLALMEATAFGTRRIIKRFDESGVPFTGIYACGGIPGKARFSCRYMPMHATAKYMSAV